MMVFSAEWFDQHQAALLRFANSFVGRRVLRIHGKRSAVGSNQITKIEPHAITWRTHDGLYACELRTHAKFAKRLYYGLKPLWYLMHAWDMAIANQLHDALNLGFDSLTVYPNAGFGGTTTDGFTERYLPTIGTSNETWASIIAGGGNGAYATSGLAVYAQAGNVSNRFNWLTRSQLTFDTSSIDASYLITDVQARLVPELKFNGIGEAQVRIVSANPNQDNQISAADHSRFGSTSYALMSYPLTTPGSPYTVWLDSNGVDQLNPGGISRYGLRLSWDADASFTGSWASNQTSGVLYYSADTSGTSSDPSLLVLYTPTYSTSASGTLLLGSSVTTTTTHHVSSIGGTLTVDGDVGITKIIAPVAGKEYVYRVYDADGTYIGLWPDVADPLEFSQRLNTPGTTTTVRLARSASRTSEVREALTDQSADPLTTEAGDGLMVAFQTTNSIGEETDVDLNYRVDVSVHYGGFEELLTESGEDILTEANENILVAVGAPLGVRVFSGFIIDYSARYGQQAGVTVTLASHGYELSHEVVKSGSNTTVTYSTTNHDVIIKDVLDTNPGTMDYSAGSVDPTGEPITVVARLNTKLEVIETVYEQSPAGWYWFGNVGDNLVYYKEKSATADHTFILGKHIATIDVKRSMEDLRNVVYFVGGDTGGGAVLYKKYEDAASITAWRQGLHRITDRRYTLAASALKRADKMLDRYAEPIYTTTISIPSEVFEIEDIQLGHMVGFAGFDNFVDDLVLQIVSFNYTPHKVTLELGELLDRQQDVIADIEQDVQGEQYQDIPNAPS